MQRSIWVALWLICTAVFQVSFAQQDTREGYLDTRDGGWVVVQADQVYAINSSTLLQDSSGNRVALRDIIVGQPANVVDSFGAQFGGTLTAKHVLVLAPH